MFCTNCGQKIMAEAKFCPKCGNAIVNEEQRVNDISKTDTKMKQDDSAKAYNSLIAIHVAMGLGALLIMYIIGEGVVYPNKYYRGALLGNMGAFACYGIIFGFIIQAIPDLSKMSRRDAVERGIGGTLIGGIAAILVYGSLYIAGQQGFLLVLGMILFTMPLPLAKSIKLSLGVNGVIYYGTEGIGRNLLVGFISGLVGVGVAIMLGAARIDLTMYAILGIIGCINYFSLVKFGKD